jgi:peptide/nickel transport system ATP-binding protein
MTTDAPLTSDEITSAAQAKGPLVMSAKGISKDYRIGRGEGAIISAVRNVSISLFQRGVVAVVGESGSGKSTVAKLFAAQERLTSGEITLDGTPIAISGRRSFREYKKSVQMVFQDPFSSLNPVHTVRYHLERPVRVHQGLSGEALENELHHLITQVRLTPPDQFLAKYPHELSGGQRQRVSIARALAARPRVILADEPVSMLDVSIRLEILALLDELRTTLDLALLYITHDIASARYFADEIVVMYAGEIVERGDAETVTQDPQHPYTQLLVSSSPDPDALGSNLRSGVGMQARQAESALSSLVGCRFSPRCPFADEQCTTVAPPTVRTGPHRAAACWHLDEATASATTIRKENTTERLSP